MQPSLSGESYNSEIESVVSHGVVKDALDGLRHQIGKLKFARKNMKEII